MAKQHSDGGVTSYWRSVWVQQPEQTVLVDEASGRRWTASEVDDASAALALRLNADGVDEGTAVVLSSAPSDATAITFIALLRLGAVVVPLNTAATPREIAHAVEVSGATLALGDDVPRFAGIVAIRSVDLPSADERERGQPIPFGLLDATASTDRALICFTSGTTGAPKGAPLTHGNMLAGTRALVECWQWSPDDVLVSALPMFHVHGLLVALAGTLTAGSTLVVHDRFDAVRVIESALNHRATLLFGVPTMWTRLVESGRLAELSALRLAVSGSAPLAPTLFEAIAAEIGSAPVERYGMTETMILTSTPVHGIRRAGTVGRPLPGMQVRLDAEGVVEVQGDSVFRGYLTHSPDDVLLRSSFTDDGWFRTGDIGEWDGDDLRLVGRASELIITGGYNVYPREVEDVVRSDAHVADVAVVGIPDDTWGEVVVAFIVLAPDGNERDNREAWNEECARELAPYKRPRAWHVVTELPRNAMGKVRRDALRDSVL